VILQQAFTRNVRSCGDDDIGKSSSRCTGKRESTDAWRGGRIIRISNEALVMSVEQRDCIIYVFIHPRKLKATSGDTRLAK
jgi:hypothetical protein